VVITKDQSTLLPNLEQRSKVEVVFEFLSRGRQPGESIHLSSAASDDDSRMVELPGDVADLMASMRAPGPLHATPENTREMTPARCPPTHAPSHRSHLSTDPH
jgi:hypothetical protein